MKAKKIALCGLLTALMLVLGYVESLLPVPGGLPGMKLGLANAALIFGAYVLDLPTVWLLMALKVCLSALLFGSVGSFLFSLSGGVLSMLGISLLCRRFSPLAVSAIAGVLHNLGQALAAILILRTPGLFTYLPLLLASGLAAGLLTGLAAQLTIKRSRGPVRPPKPPNKGVPPLTH